MREHFVYNTDFAVTGLKIRKREGEEPNKRGFKKEQRKFDSTLQVGPRIWQRSLISS